VAVIVTIGVVIALSRRSQAPATVASSSAGSVASTTSMAPAAGASGTSVVPAIAWFQQNVALLKRFPSDFEAMTTAANNGSATDLTAVCEKMTVDAGDLRQALPVPDQPEVTAALSDAATHYLSATSHCIHGVGTLNKDEVNAFTSEVGMANSDLVKVATLVKQVAPDISF
jgi:hypothetical protein